MPIADVYVIGSLRNENIPRVSADIRSLGYSVFDDWYSAGPEADDYLRDYYRNRKMKYSEVLNSHAAQHIFKFDKEHLDNCDCAVLVLPAGKSGHLELGYIIGSGKPGYILMDGEPERVDIMHSFATKVFMNKEEMLDYFKQPDVQGRLGKANGLTSVYWSSPIPPNDFSRPVVRGTEIRGPLVEESPEGEVRGCEIPSPTRSLDRWKKWALFV